MNKITQPYNHPDLDHVSHVFIHTGNSFVSTLNVMWQSLICLGKDVDGEFIPIGDERFTPEDIAFARGQKLAILSTVSPIKSGTKK